jgi:SpoU rRNA methylase family enzyme
MHVIKLNGYNATTENGEKLELGTFDSYGEEQLQIVKAPDWENLSVIATFNPPNKKPVQVAVDSVTGVIKVPKEATADLYGVGTIVFVGLADGVQRISADCEYIVRKHSNASGTEPAEPTPDLLQQVLTLSKDAQTAAQYAAGTPVQVCYKLAKPVPFTATGAQPIPALAGVNTVLTDADSATVTGRADPIKRITDLEDAVASQT